MAPTGTSTARADEFERLWARNAGYLEPALNGAFTLDDVRATILAGNATLWPLERSAVVTEILEYPAKRVLRIWLAGGELSELLAFLPAADNYAHECGCSAIEIDGRKGWARVLPGYTEARVVLTKEIE